MAFDWTSATVGDFVDLQRGNTYQSALLDTPGPVLLGLASIERDGGFRSDKLRTYGGESPAKLLVYPGDMYVSLKDVTQSGDLLGSVARVPSFIAVGRMTQDTVKLIFKDELIDRSYLYWVLRTPEYREYCRARGMGTTNLSLSRDDFLSFPVPEPTSVRLAIHRTLDAIEGKITLNRDIAQTLEAMAQAIFKSWFVDFNPVKAKVAAIQKGRDPLRAAMSAISGKPDAELDALPPDQYKQLAATAALFPGEMEESELGEIPRGWAPTPIRDVAEVLKGKSYSSKDLIDNDQVALVTLKSFERGGGFRMNGFKPYIGPYKTEQVVLPGELIVAYTDVTQAAELIGKPAVVVGVCHFKTLVASLDVGIVRPVNERVSRQFLYGLFMTETFQTHTFAHTSGTTVLHLAKEGVPSYIFACPDEGLVGIYSEAAEVIAMKKQRLLDQNQSLTTLRDTLLPKLLSGELSVGALDEAAGAA